jgi:uncharacterized protein (DUF305 family)
MLLPMKHSALKLRARSFRASPRLLFVGLLAAGACAGGGGGVGGGGTGAAAAPSATPRSSASTEELAALYRARKDSALLSVSEADVEFITGMISHHAQALVMSGFAPGNGANPTVRTLAARIINAQKDEIHNMQTWLSDRGRPVPHVAEGGEVHAMHGTDHSMHMAGMLSPEQLRELEAAKGPEFDRLFLTYMIQHHQGAVSMVHDLFAIDGAAQDDLIFKIASDIQVDQITEINRMQQMLDALTTQPRRR